MTFFSDLDNTLIFSHRKNFLKEKILVEYLKGKEQSYMPTELAQLLSNNKDIILVPVTTRSVEQYLRIHALPEIAYNKHALVCNGGVLLIDGKVDTEWLLESIEISQIQSLEVQRILKKVQEDGKAKSINILQDFMFYFTCDDVDAYFRSLKDIANLTDVFLGKDLRKIYVIASEINKGSSVERYIRRFGIEDYFTAGDSEFDIPMLNLKSKAIASATLRNSLSNNMVSYSEYQFLFQDIGKIIQKIVSGDSE